LSDIDSITRKLEAFCAYQERCLFEIKNKLEEFDLSDSEKTSIISSLRTNKFWNEERFAEAYCQGKVRIKRWGKQKIKAGLIQKHVESGTIKSALESINELDYLYALQSLYEKKSQELKSEKDPWTKKQKIMRYLASRGFSFEEINSVVNNE
jgi:regulatory protein